MNKKHVNHPTLNDDHLGCFGDFDLSDRLCRRLCALRLRCAIEWNQNDRLEILEDLVSMEEVVIKLH
jgi:hypothetical protein